MASERAATLTVTVDPGQVLTRTFLGFGVQWEYEGDRPELNSDEPAWNRNWPAMLKRIDFMKPAILRVIHNAQMYSRLEQGRFVADYDSPRMRVTYQVLDYAKSRGIPVVFGEWWLPKPYFVPLGDVTNPRWSDELIVPFLVHLRTVKGYQNICWFNLMNEPAGLEKAPNVPLDYDAWKAALINLHEALKKQGLDKHIRLVGTDGPGDWNQWLERVTKDAELRDRIGAYEYHLYAHLNTDKWCPSLLEGKMGEGEFLPRRKMITANDPQGADKPFFMGEAGIDDGNKGDNQIHRNGFPYGVWMADYAIQAMRAGQAGLIAWNMDDAMHVGGSHGPRHLKGWGFWNSLGGSKDYPAEDFAIRPWFYTWSLLCRSFPCGCRILSATSTGDTAVRVAAAELPDGRGYSFAVINEASEARRVSIVLPKAKAIPSLLEYRYFTDQRPVDADGLPLPSQTRKNPDLTKGLDVLLPSQGVVILTPP
jgi:hypothetical protein